MVCGGEMGQKCSKSWTSPLVGVSRERAQWVSSVFLVLSWFLYSCLGRRSTGVTKNITSGSVTLPCWRIEERFNEIQSSLIFICIFFLLRHLNISENTSWRKGTAPLLKCCSLAFFFSFSSFSWDSFLTLCFTQDFDLVIHFTHWCSCTYFVSIHHSYMVFPCFLLPFYCWSTQRGTCESWANICFHSATCAWDETFDFFIIICFVHYTNDQFKLLFSFSFVQQRNSTTHSRIILEV